MKLPKNRPPLWIILVVLTPILIPLAFWAALKAHDYYRYITVDSKLPRYTSLKLFDPHRPDFTCVREADVVPPIDPEAELWHQEAMALTSSELWASQRNYPRALELWRKAAERKHWKAQINLAGAYLRGEGVAPDVNQALRLIEEAMAWGVPMAWDNMGTFWARGVAGLGPDATVAWSFYQKAADMGSPSAQTHIGKSLTASYDSPQNLWWANKAIGRQMLECAFDQGHGSAAYQLGLEYELDPESTNARNNQEFKAKALKYYHEGVKFGCEDCARSLRLAFGDGPKDSVAPTIDLERKRRYGVFQEALRVNEFLRFPNLDKVLPLPPAKLPYWDGKPESLLNAAKPVHPQPGAPKVSVVYPHPLERLGYLGPMSRQFDIPAGFALKPWSGSVVDAGQAAPADGYYQPVIDPRHQHKPLLHSVRTGTVSTPDRARYLLEVA